MAQNPEFPCSQWIKVAKIVFTTSFQAAARVWVRAGAEGVVIAGRRKEALQKIAEELTSLSQGKTKILAVPADVVSEKSIENLFAEVKKTFGRTADVVVANAGIAPPSVPLAEQAIDTWWSAYVSPLYSYGIDDMMLRL